jgi:hypothetical protein
MSDGFTFEDYNQLLDAVIDSGYDTVTVREYLSADELPVQFVAFRHDIDRKAENAAKMAEAEAERGIAATYYFRTSTFDPDLARWIESLGHEVGYHYEDYVRAGGELRAAHRRFRSNLSELRQTVDVDTICMHGNPLSPHDNRDMWTAPGAPGFAAYDLLGEAYLSMDFTDVTYFSDTGRTWRDGPLKIKDHTMGEGSKAVTADTTADLIGLLERREVTRSCVLAHPNRWADSYSELLAERSKDRAVNAIKRGMQLLPTTS